MVSIERQKGLGCCQVSIEIGRTARVRVRRRALSVDRGLLVEGCGFLGRGVGERHRTARIPIGYGDSIKARTVKADIDAVSHLVGGLAQVQVVNNP